MNLALNLMLAAVFGILSLSMAVLSAWAFIKRSWRAWETLSVAVTFGVSALLWYFTAFDSDPNHPSPHTDLLWKATQASLVVMIVAIWYTHKHLRKKHEVAMMKARLQQRQHEAR